MYTYMYVYVYVHVYVGVYIRHRAWRAGVPVAMRGSGFEGPGCPEAPGGVGGPEGFQGPGMWGPSPTERKYI